MKIEMNDKRIGVLLYAFLTTGACAYGAIFATYLLWFIVVIE